MNVSYAAVSDAGWLAASLLLLSTEQQGKQAEGTR
jgi:hypothetical protein